jgi:HD-GYP domain-containing protein (c-di-GMP phosphodiesterase class II)
MSDLSSQRTLAGKTEEQLLNLFFVLYKTSRILEQNNETFMKQLDNFMSLFHAATAERPELIIKTVGGHYFVGDRMVRFNDQGLSGAADIVSEWKKMGLGGVCFDADIGPDEIAGFFKFISSVKPDDNNLESVVQRLNSAGLMQIRLLSTQEEDEESPVTEEERQKFRQMARTTFFKAMSTVQEVVASARDGEDINVAKTKRVVHGLIDHITRDEQSLIELTAIRDFDDYTYIHSTNVTIYALTIGIRMELDRARLSQLGFSALFHDVGKVRLPQDLIRKPDAFDENDWVQMQRHPLLGAKTILRNLKLDTHTARAARTAFEHHINNDFTGYPTLHYDRRPPNLFSRIVSVVDTFDALTSGRVYLRNNLTPDAVLKKMRFQMKAKFDPFLLKIFNDIIGIYPAGSLVLLTTDEIALVLTNNENEPLRPYVKIVGDRGGLIPEPIWADLSQAEHAHRKLVRQIDPERYSLNIRDFVLDD